jgi:hypothetical protein
MTALDRAILYGIEDLQARHDFCGSKHLDPKFVVAEFTDPPGEKLATAVQGIERFRPARRHPPFDRRR